MISLLIYLLVLALVFGLCWWVISLIPMPAPFGLVVQVVFAIIVVLVLINLLLPMAGMHGRLLY